MKLQSAILTVAGCGLTTCNAATSSCSGSSQHSCDHTFTGYQCQSNISHFWGQYSPYFEVETQIPRDTPPQCTVTFAQILSRHGARNPTASKTTVYAALINSTKKSVKSFPGKYAFLANYTYTLGADDLTVFGELEMVKSGIKFYDRYRALARKQPPFVRSSGEARVVESAMNFTQGFHQEYVRRHGKGSNDGYPYNIVVIPEANGVNNTLNHELCTAFENGTDSTIASSAQNKWLAVFGPPIRTRLNNDLKGANYSLTDVISFMDLCPFNTIAKPDGAVSPFCALFTETEWHQYSYYESLGKWYGYGPGNPLGPTQGVGWTNELIARLTNTPVKDHTSTNRTLDSNPATFPIGKNNTLFADFSHDNDITAILSAMGIYNTTAQLSNTTLQTTAQTNGYSAAWTVPFAARVYVEKLSCGGYSRCDGGKVNTTAGAEEYVRVIVNDRVQPLSQCGGDAYGRCTLSKFVDSLSFARDGGLWNQCFS